MDSRPEFTTNGVNLVEGHTDDKSKEDVQDFTSMDLDEDEEFETMESKNRIGEYHAHVLGQTSDKKRRLSDSKLATSTNAIDDHYRSGTAYLLGNLVELSELLKQSASERFQECYVKLQRSYHVLISYLTVTKSFVYYKHPLLIKQLTALAAPSALRQICDHIIITPPTSSSSFSASSSSSSSSSSTQNSLFSNDLDSLAEVRVMCGLLDGLLEWWPLSETPLLSTLAFSPDLLPALWTTLMRSFLDPTGPLCVLTQESSTSTEQWFGKLSGFSLNVRRVLTEQLIENAFTSLTNLFCLCFSYLLVVLSDDEFYNQQKPFSLTQVVNMVWLCKQFTFHVHWGDFQSTPSGNRLRKPVTRLFQQLRERHSRKPFCHNDAWLIQHISLGHDAKLGSGTTALVLEEVPFVIPFDRRVELFYHFIEEDKKAWANGDFGQRLSFMHGTGAHVLIRRNRVLVDGFQRLNHLGHALKGRVNIFVFFSN